MLTNLNGQSVYSEFGSPLNDLSVPSAFLLSRHADLNTGKKLLF